MPLLTLNAVISLSSHPTSLAMPLRSFCNDSFSGGPMTLMVQSFLLGTGGAAGGNSAVVVAAWLGAGGVEATTAAVAGGAEATRSTGSGRGSVPANLLTGAVAPTPMLWATLSMTAAFTSSPTASSSSALLLPALPPLPTSSMSSASYLKRSLSSSATTLTLSYCSAWPLAHFTHSAARFFFSAILKGRPFHSATSFSSRSVPTPATN
mmetsp:Transcript_24424/g.50942  ORF Transcript_24424/g.50942 Transcript_24424/m.50942 type:complete len:208 (-) Transcript_24424:9712-10335(-)